MLQVLPVLLRYLSGDSRAQVIWRVLSSLTELVRSEEFECLQAAERQKEEADTDSKSKSKVRMRQHVTLPSQWVRCRCHYAALPCEACSTWKGHARTLRARC